MKKILAIAFVLAFGVGTLYAQTENFHSFTVKDIDGKDFALAQLKGKKVMVVNTASKCGYTKQYADLQKLYEQYGGENFVIIGFPANNFMGQEPGSNAEIKSFCSTQFNISFPLMSKISVKGDDMAPVYQWLTKKAKNGQKDVTVSWNFNKFLVDENGNWVNWHKSNINPLDEEIINWIKN